MVPCSSGDPSSHFMRRRGSLFLFLRLPLVERPQYIPLSPVNKRGAIAYTLLRASSYRARPHPLSPPLSFHHIFLDYPPTSPPSLMGWRVLRPLPFPPAWVSRGCLLALLPFSHCSCDVLETASISYLLLLPYQLPHEHLLCPATLMLLDRDCAVFLPPFCLSSFIPPFCVILSVISASVIGLTQHQVFHGAPDEVLGGLRTLLTSLLCESKILVLRGATFDRPLFVESTLPRVHAWRVLVLPQQFVAER